MHDTRFTKQAIERRAFDALADILAWRVEPGSVEQPPPPHPDIRFKIATDSPLAVELVAIDPATTRLRMSNMSGTPYAWRQAMNWWSEDTRQQFLADLQDVHVSVHFANDAGIRDRAKVLFGLQSFFLSRPDFAGRVMPEDLEFPQGFRLANVGRFKSISNGPEVVAPSGDYLRPPQVDKIKEKLCDKSYDSAGAPMELFAYAMHDEPDGAVGWLESIQSTVAEHIAGSKFRRVHLFHVGFKRHIWSYP
jgi:hypothetical protein